MSCKDFGGVAELADAGDLKSLAARLAGSSPAAPTTEMQSTPSGVLFYCSLSRRSSRHTSTASYEKGALRASQAGLNMIWEGLSDLGCNLDMTDF